jgi:hypothetical protein
MAGADPPTRNYSNLASANKQRRLTLKLFEKQKGETVFMKTIQKLTNKIEGLAKEYVPTRLRERFAEGVTSFGLSDFTSLNTSGRMLRDNPEAGKQRVYRLGRDTRMSSLARRIITHVFLPKSGSLHLSLDHSQFGPFYIAILALGTHKGRAIPVWLEVQKRDNIMVGQN